MATFGGRSLTSISSHQKSTNHTIRHWLHLLCSLLLVLTTTAHELLRGVIPQENEAHPPTSPRNLYDQYVYRKPAIAALVPSNDMDIDDFCYALKSLNNLSSLPSNVPLLVFNEGDLTSRQKKTIKECTHLPVSFPKVDFHSFPTGFNLERENVKFRHTMMIGVHHLHRKEWGYVQMIRFWTTLLWKHPATQEFDTVMRIDTDSCFVGAGGALDASLPFLQERFVYRCPGVGRGANDKIEGLFAFTKRYMETNDITPRNPELWNHVVDTWNTYQTLPVFTTNFEVTRKEFFQREDVVKWHEALTEEWPFGVLRKRWGDAQTRVMTMVMFASEEEISRHRHVGYEHGRGRCRDYFQGESS